jgi:hypothetical protein
MTTFVNFLENMILSGAIVYVTYSLMRFTACGVCWLISKLSFKCATSRTLQADRTPMTPVPSETETAHRPV